mgnify:CR=1 FL=1
MDFWYGYTDIEIAAQFAVTPRTIYNWRQKAFAAIRNYHERNHYELICAAVNGDREALDQILIYYDDYINTLATVKAEDAQGNEYQYVDGDLKTRIQMKLVDAIPKWRGLRNVDDRFI